jgi:fatty-acyl-CoA synthase
MRRDSRGFFYFVDRVGETYRWKGENISTMEVLSALTKAPGVLEGVVYGVAVPGTDGRAGMAALVVAAGFDVNSFYAHANQSLPVYARPSFLRLLPILEATGTFKPKKQDLMREGFDPALISDPLYVADQDTHGYVVMDSDSYAAIASGNWRL